MADERAPVPSPPSSAQFTAVPGANPPSENTNGALTQSRELNKPAAVPEMVMLGRWMLGALLVAVCGWGLVILSLYLMYQNKKDMQIGAAVTVLLDLGLILLLERNFWLSRFMGLRIEPGERPWQSAFWLCLLGVPGLLFRSTNFHPEGEARAETRKRPQPQQHGDSVREVVETIVFVVVLVLLLKSFAAEAFVIPTGSMAETLLGYQKEVTCPDCGLQFPINCSQEVDPSEGARPTRVFACVCPNCRQRIHFPDVPRDYLLNFKDSIEIRDPGWNSGDRVLVAKFVYDLFNKDPERLDVVVFKYPGGNDFPQSGPHRNHVPMNYIKRCVGLSGETIAISGGKLYYLSPDEGPHYDDYEKAKQDPELMATLWKKEHMHIDDPETCDLFRKGRFRIIRKDPENILAMMRLVFDNDHPSRSDPASTDRWKSADGGWSALAAHGFRHDGNNGGRTDWLRYQHILRDFPGRPALITDMMGYNTYQSGNNMGGGFGHTPLLGDNWVGDLILECEAAIDNPQGELTLELSRGVDRFRARWDLSTGTCTLFRGEQKLESKPTALKKKGSYRLRFANVDQRLAVWVDGDLPFDNGVTYAPPEDPGPRKENDFEPASIGVSGASVAVNKLRLFRDTYYTVGGAKQGQPHEADVHDFDPTDPIRGRWKDLSDPPFVTLYVQPDHFLCLGDNSPESSDGRSWGTVPRRLLLGRALLVYYPFGRAGRIR
jgi:signal peptidase I